MDRVGFRGQHGVHLELADQGGGSAAGGTHRWEGRDLGYTGRRGYTGTWLEGHTGGRGGHGEYTGVKDTGGRRDVGYTAG